MLGPISIQALTIAGLALLVLAGLHDFAVRTVPNWIAGVLLADGIVLRLIDSSLIPWAVGATLVLFMLTFLFWRLGWMGGGDVKLLTAAAMFVPPLHVVMLVSATALAGGLLALGYFVAGSVVPAPHGGRPHSKLARMARCEIWRLSRRGPLPYAAAIAVGGVIATLHA